MDKRPLGIFDSGIGGTSIWREIKTLLPNEDCIYLADSKNAPYGERPQQEIRALSIKNTELLLEEGCKLIVVACNTATTNAISKLRDAYKIPFIGIEPAIKPAALGSRTKTIGILATKGTLSSSLFHNTAALHAAGITIIEKEGLGIVPLLEAGKLESPEMDALLSEYLSPMLDAGIDYLVLGCSHYPYLIPKLRTILPEHVTILDSGAAVAKQTKNVLMAHDQLHLGSTPGKHLFYSNANSAVLRYFLENDSNVHIRERVF